MLTSPISAHEAEQRLKVSHGAYLVHNSSHTEDEFEYEVRAMYGEPIGFGYTPEDAWLYAASRLPAEERGEREPPKTKTELGENTNCAHCGNPVSFGPSGWVHEDADQRSCERAESVTCKHCGKILYGIFMDARDSVLGPYTVWHHANGELYCWPESDESDHEAEPADRTVLVNKSEQPDYRALYEQERALADRLRSKLGQVDDYLIGWELAAGKSTTYTQALQAYENLSVQAALDPAVSKPVAVLIDALIEAKEALHSCYNVQDYPANGRSAQDFAISSVEAALAAYQSARNPKQGEM